MLFKISTFTINIQQHAEFISDLLKKKHIKNK